MTDVVMLMRYLDVLLKLEENGYSCRVQVYEVMQELHKQMGFKNSGVKISASGAMSISGGTIVHPNTIEINNSWENSKTAGDIAKEITATLEKAMKDVKKSQSKEARATSIFDIHG